MILFKRPSWRIWQHVVVCLTQLLRLIVLVLGLIKDVKGQPWVRLLWAAEQIWWCKHGGGFAEEAALPSFDCKRLLQKATKQMIPSEEKKKKLADACCLHRNLKIMKTDRPHRYIPYCCLRFLPCQGQINKRVGGVNMPPCSRLQVV